MTPDTLTTFLEVTARAHPNGLEHERFTRPGDNERPGSPTERATRAFHAWENQAAMTRHHYPTERRQHDEAEALAEVEERIALNARLGLHR